MELQTMKIGSREYPILGYIKTKQMGIVPLVDIPQMSDERWAELVREHPPGQGGDGMSTAEPPRAVVDGVSVELERMSSLLTVLAQIQNSDLEVNLTDFGITMGVLRDYLDIQIKALDSIQWPGARTVGA